MAEWRIHDTMAVIRNAIFLLGYVGFSSIAKNRSSQINCKRGLHFWQNHLQSYFIQNKKMHKWSWIKNLQDRELQPLSEDLKELQHIPCVPYPQSFVLCEVNFGWESRWGRGGCGFATMSLKTISWDFSWNFCKPLNSGKQNKIKSNTSAMHICQEKYDAGFSKHVFSLC